MWKPDQIAIEIDEAEGSELIVVIVTPVGSMRLMGEVGLNGDVLMIDRAHVDGLAPGCLSRSNLNAIGRKILEVTGARSLDLRGSTRTTGRNPGRPPRPIRFPRPVAARDDGTD